MNGSRTAHGSVQDALNYAEAVADWLLEQGEARLASGDVNAAMHFTHAAACILSRQNRLLASVRVESILQGVARLLPDRTFRAEDVADEASTPNGCLHVLTEALPAGGLTAMATRWIENDTSGRKHFAALLSQSVSVPAALQEAVAETGGRVYSSAPESTLADKALWLRALARAKAAHVVLHVDVSDVICPAAFGIEGGPPVMLVNHSAHVFWTGGSVADLVLNCRGSALEEAWAFRYRGLPRVASVPIPLADRIVPASVREEAIASRRRAKAELGIPTEAVVILTVGAAFKFLPANGLDFVEVCCSILKAVPEAVLLGVGFGADKRWLDSSVQVGGRIRSMGVLSQSALAAVREIADVYVEGFPFGTTTALLEAGLAGVPLVLAPSECPPPYGSDGVALDDILQRPETVERFRKQVIRLCRDPVQRELQGRVIQESIRKHHTGSGWNAHLERALHSLPATHALTTLLSVDRTPSAIHEYWTGFVQRWGAGYSMTLETAIGNALRAGHRPRLTDGIARAGKERNAMGDAQVPTPVLQILCNHLLPLLPLPVGRRLYRLAVFLCRPSLLIRIGARLGASARSSPQKAAWYEEYRQLPR